MLKKCFYAGLMVTAVFMPGCGTLFQKDKALKEYQINEEQYSPYKIKNTIDGYREFISLYPKNQFVSEAKLQIENLEFAPFEQDDSVEGYMEFKLRYPHNRHSYKASVKIEQSEVKRYERIDTAAGYKEFLSKYPDSNFAILAKERLQELEFRELDAVLREQYGFDLLAYRLHLKRLKKTLKKENGFDLAAFTGFASLITHEEKRYFHTHLIYSTDISSLDVRSEEMSGTFFDHLVSPSLIYLDKNFPPHGTIDGFSFDISWSPHSYYGDRRIVLTYYFTRHAVELFTDGRLDKAGLLAQSSIVASEKAAAAYPSPYPPEQKLPDTPVKQETAEREKLDGIRIMAIVSERDRGEDSIIASSWQRGRHTMKTIAKQKKLRGAGDILDKSVIRYIDPPAHYGTIILIWNYKDREKAFWYKLLHSAPGRIADTESLRPPAESDFSLIDYLDVNLSEEKHLLLRREDYEGKMCFVVESVPIRIDMKYGKRLSWIEENFFIPLKIEYRDKEGKPWKIMRAEWQQLFGLWFWKKVVVDNIHSAEKTTITIDDVRINQGLNDIDFTVQGLERQKHGF